MELAPLPDHDHTTDPTWVRLFNAYTHVITPLRTLGLTTDVETCGSEYTITANLSDGSYLSIAADHSLPADPADVAGWTVLRAFDDQPTRAVVYDSTEDGNDAEHGDAIAPMLGRIVHWLLAGRRAIHREVPARLGALLANLAPRPSIRVQTSTAFTRATAEALERLAAEQDLPNLIGIQPDTQGIHVTVEPEDLAAWRIWIDLIGADDGNSLSTGELSKARGTWGGTPVRLYGLGVPRLNSGALRSGLAANQIGGPTA
ncbi:hypothetical protein [Streptomyces sp. NPDC056308]|uniref:hypothetical protein n=1 Tax=Streptomyces sp. NPDC056308 TaxID=3345780 RepID=UPI0035DF57E3